MRGKIAQPLVHYDLKNNTIRLPVFLLENAFTYFWIQQMVRKHKTATGSVLFFSTEVKLYHRLLVAVVMTFLSNLLSVVFTTLRLAIPKLNILRLILRLTFVYAYKVIIFVLYLFLYL